MLPEVRCPKSIGRARRGHSQLFAPLDLRADERFRRGVGPRDNGDSIGKVRIAESRARRLQSRTRLHALARQFHPTFLVRRHEAAIFCQFGFAGNRLPLAERRRLARLIAVSGADRLRQLRQIRHRDPAVVYEDQHVAPHLHHPHMTEDRSIAQLEILRPREAGRQRQHQIVKCAEASIHVGAETGQTAKRSVWASRSISPAHRPDLRRKLDPADPIALNDVARGVCVIDETAPNDCCLLSAFFGTSRHAQPPFSPPLIVAASIALFAFLASPFASAVDYVVTTTDDTVNAGDGVTSLREAITSANTAGGANTITFSATLYSAGQPALIQLGSTLPNLTGNLAINGPGANLMTVSGQNSVRIFRVLAGATVTITELTLSGGVMQGANGADGVNAGNPPTAGSVGQGGGIFNSGSLTLAACSFLQNSARGGAGGGGAGNIAQNGAMGADGLGGAVYSDGTALNITRCTFSQNSAMGGGGGPGASIQFGGGGSGNGAAAGHAKGGAIYVSSGTTSIKTSTFAGNTASGGVGGNGGASNFSGGERPGGVGGNSDGGAIYTTVPVSMLSCTVVQGASNAGNGGLQTNFSQNAAPGTARGGGLVANGVITIGNCLVAANTSLHPVNSTISTSDVFGTFTSQDFNLIGGADANATGITGAADQKGTIAAPINALLDPLGAVDNGGPIGTVRLRKGSPAVDKGKEPTGLGLDQRNFTRPVDLADGTYPNAAGGDGSDIGAFESQTLPNDVPVATANQTVSGTVGVAFSGQQLIGTDGDNDPLTFSLVDGTMPPGLTLNSNGAVTGTASAATQVTLTFNVNDGMADSAAVSFTVSVAELPSLVVNTDNDIVSSFDGLTSLREALSFAANDGTSTPVTFDAVFFSVPGTITVSASGRFNVFTDLDLNGPAAGLTLSGGNQRAIFQFSGGTVNIRNITLANGQPDPFQNGGAATIFAGTVNFSSCTMRDNGRDGFCQGGAIYNGGGTVTLTNCTLAGNRATGSTSAGGAIGQVAGTTTLFNCTLTNNAVADGNGGGLAHTGGTLTIGNCIVTGDTATGGTGPDISGTITSLGYNMIGVTSGATINGTTTGNQIGVNPGLDPDGLGYNGGPTQTIALAPGSPAIDAGKALDGATTDQRGRTRPFDNATITNASGGDGSDIGAYETQAPEPDIAVEQPAGTDLLTGTNSSFGTQEVGGAAGIVFTLRNKGALPLSLIGGNPVALAGLDASQFVVNLQPGSTVGTGASTSFAVSFVPGSTGAKIAMLTIASDDPDENPFTLTLTGVGVDTQTIPPTLTSPLSGDLVFPQASVTFDLPEAALAGSVKIVFDNGTAYESVLGASEESAGNHTVTIDTTAAGMPLGLYSVTLSYQDASGHPAAGATSTNVRIRPDDPISTVQFAQGAPVPGAGTNGLPADALLASFRTPATNDDGDIAFIAKWTSGATVKGTGLFFNSSCLGIVGGSVPGIAGSQVTSFTDPVTDAGHVACISQFTVVPNPPSSVVLSNAASGGPLEVIASVGGVATVDGAKFKTFKAVDIAEGYAAVFAKLTAGTGTTPTTTAASDLGLWVKDGTGPLTLVLREGQTVAGKVIKTLVSFVPAATSPGQGRGWLQLSPTGGAQVLALAFFTDESQGIIVVDVDDIGNPIVLSLSKQTGVGAPGIANATFASYGYPALASSGANAFRAKLTTGVGGVTAANARGIFYRDGFVSGYTPLARLGADAGSTGTKFKRLKDPVLGNDGGLAFLAKLETSSTVKGLATSTIWWQPPGEPLTLLAQGGAGPGPDLPTAARWETFTSLAIAGGGRGPIFAATLVPGKGGVTAAKATGVWACDFTGAPRLLLRTGDRNIVTGKKLSSFRLLKATVGSTGVTRSFNDSAQIVWLATFTDKTQAIVTTEVP